MIFFSSFSPFLQFFFIFPHQPSPTPGPWYIPLQPLPGGIWNKKNINLKNEIGKTEKKVRIRKKQEQNFMGIVSVKNTFITIYTPSSRTSWQPSYGNDRTGRTNSLSNKWRFFNTRQKSASVAHYTHRWLYQMPNGVGFNETHITG